MEPLIQKLGITKEEAGKLEVINKIKRGFLDNKCHNERSHSERYSDIGYWDSNDKKYHDGSYNDNTYRDHRDYGVYGDYKD